MAFLMIDIVLLKNIHITLVVISVSSFLLRFVGKQLGAGFVERRFVKTTPHIVDTLLLASGVTLAVIYRLSPLDAHWLLAKLVLIVGYIGAGTGAMRASTDLKRTGFALLALFLIVSVVLLATLKPF